MVSSVAQQPYPTVEDRKNLPNVGREPRGWSALSHNNPAQLSRIAQTFRDSKTFEDTSVVVQPGRRKWEEVGVTIVTQIRTSPNILVYEESYITKYMNTKSHISPSTYMTLGREESYITK